MDTRPVVRCVGGSRDASASVSLRPRLADSPAPRSTSRPACRGHPISRLLPVPAPTLIPMSRVLATLTNSYWPRPVVNGAVAGPAHRSILQILPNLSHLPSVAVPPPFLASSACHLDRRPSGSSYRTPPPLFSDEPHRESQPRFHRA